MTQLSADEARRDLRLLRRAFNELHPGLLRYATQAEIDAAFTAADAEVAQGASRGQMLLIVARLAATVRCGHTWTNPLNQAPAVVREVFDRADKLPLTLRLVEGRFLITGSMVPGLTAGAELLAVNGVSVPQIVQTLLPMLRADGRSAVSDGKRLSQLDTGPNGGAMDRLFPLQFPPAADGWRLTVRDRDASAPRSLTVAPTSVAARAQALPGSAGDSTPPWRFEIDGDTAVLTLPTFAFWRGGFDAPAFLQRSFDTLRERGVPYLLIDIRDNEGGDNTGRLLVSQLLRQPYTIPPVIVESAYERAPYALAKYLDTWDYGFFDRTGEAVRGSGRNWRLPGRPALTLQPVAAPYAGRAVLLVGPQNSSAGFLLARDAQRSGTAVLLGQPTGGNLRGLNGGEVAWINLPASGVGVDIPLLASFYTGDEPDRGVLPDIAVAPTWADAVAGIDTEMVAARKLIANWRANRQQAQR